MAEGPLGDEVGWGLLWVVVVREGLSQEVGFELSPQLHKGISLGDSGERTFQAET